MSDEDVFTMTGSAADPHKIKQYEVNCSFERCEFENKIKYGEFQVSGNSLVKEGTSVHLICYIHMAAEYEIKRMAKEHMDKVMR